MAVTMTPADYGTDNPTPWGDFPVDEYQARVAKAQRLMRKEGIEVLLLAQRENVEYFSGFLTGHWNSKTFACAVLLVPADRDPVLVLPGFFAGTAAGSTFVTDHVYFDEPHARPRDFGLCVLAGLDKLGARTGTIGVESGENLAPTWNMIDRDIVFDGLSGANVVSGAEVIWGCRMIKSPREIERMRTIVRWSDEAILHARTLTHQGSSEVDVASWCSSKAFELGADGIAFMNIRAGLPRYPCADSIPVDRPVGDSEILLMDIGIKKLGYSTDVAYIGYTGQPTDDHKRYYDAVIRSHEATLAAIRPGISSKELFKVGRNVLEDFGEGKYLDMLGHGIGMDVHEPPIVTPYDDRVLEPGMVFAIEPWIYDTARLGFFCVEEIVVVTEDGFENLSSIERDEIWVID